mgnify:CR=1 FL=1
MTDTLLLREDAGHIATLTLNSPSNYNALSDAMLAALSAEIARLSVDRSIRVVVLKGAGKAFCAGHDVKDGFHDAMPETGWAGLSRRYDLFKPLIAANVIRSINLLAVGMCEFLTSVNWDNASARESPTITNNVPKVDLIPFLKKD